jgi:filamentous hemagglutinin family protein
VLLLGLVWLPVPPASAQSQGLVVRDGSLRKELPLEVHPGLDPLGQSATYLITPELGEQHGSNLFHSFERFGIASGETATFTGPDPIDEPQSVSNVISRVTGGTRSEIDGTLRSTIPGADVWLLNPSRVVLGEGAKLEVRGSFHAGTGDHVALGESGERFSADGSQPGVLATAPPTAFGFLGEGGAASLAVEGGLEVTRGEALLAGGDVTLSGVALVWGIGTCEPRRGRLGA